MKKHTLWLGLAVVAAVLPVAVWGGGGGGFGGGGGGFGGGGGGFGGGGPGGMAFNQTDFIIQQLLQVTDQNEIAVLQPKVQKLVDTRSAAQTVGGRGGRGRGMGGMGGPGGPGGAQAQSAVAKALADLQAALNDTNAKPEDITAKVKAYREAATKAREDYKAAQDDLKKVLSIRQEGILVANGYME